MRLIVTGDIVDVRAKKLVSGDVGTRIIVDLAPVADIGALRELMEKPLQITIEGLDRIEGGKQ